jgi:hypothetical protein
MNIMSRALLVGGALLALVVPDASVQAQRRGQQPAFLPNVPYDGRLTFVRVKYSLPEFGAGGFRGGRDIPWSHDYPRGERNFTKIVSELSTARVRIDASNILTLDDPQLGRYPIAYMAEAGFWRPSEAEALGLRNYLTKGGFIIFDDFAGEHWMNFETQMKKVLPNLRPIELTASHPIFDSFYRIASIEYDHPVYRGYKSVFYGVFEQNDPTKRMLAIVNYNNDLSEYWEFSDTGMYPLDMSNEAYKLGVNYIIYALTR